MDIEDQLKEEWQQRPVESRDLDCLLKLIETNWKRAIEVLGPAGLTLENTHPAFGHISFAFGSAISMRGKSALYQAHIDNLTIMPKDLANQNCFSMLNAGLDDQRRSHGMYVEKLKAILAMEDESVAAIATAIQEALEQADEAQKLTRLFKEGLATLWKQFYMPETLAAEDSTD